MPLGRKRCIWNVSRKYTAPNELNRNANVRVEGCIFPGGTFPDPPVHLDGDTS